MNINGSVITIDAKHTITEKIIERGADYVLGVKDNQPGLVQAVAMWFSAADTGTMDRPFWDNIQVEKDHGRIETRRCVVTNNIDWLKEQNQHWCGLQSLIMIESTSEIIGRKPCSGINLERT